MASGPRNKSRVSSLDLDAMLEEAESFEDASVAELASTRSDPALTAGDVHPHVLHPEVALIQAENERLKDALRQHRAENAALKQEMQDVDDHAAECLSALGAAYEEGATLSDEMVSIVEGHGFVAPLQSSLKQGGEQGAAAAAAARRERDIMARQLRHATEQAETLRKQLESAAASTVGSSSRHSTAPGTPEPYPIEMEEALQRLGRTTAKLAESQQARSDLEDELEQIQVELAREREQQKDLEGRLVEAKVQLASRQQGYEDLLDDKRRLDDSYRKLHEGYLAHKVKMDKYRRWVRSAQQHLIMAGLAQEDGALRPVKGAPVLKADGLQPGNTPSGAASKQEESSSGGVFGVFSWLAGSGGARVRTPHASPPSKASSPPESPVHQAPTLPARAEAGAGAGTGSGGTASGEGTRDLSSALEGVDGQVAPHDGTECDKHQELHRPGSVGAIRQRAGAATGVLGGGGRREGGSGGGSSHRGPRRSKGRVEVGASHGGATGPGTRAGTQGGSGVGSGSGAGALSRSTDATGAVGRQGKTQQQSQADAASLGGGGAPGNGAPSPPGSRGTLPPRTPSGRQLGSGQAVEVEEDSE